MFPCKSIKPYQHATDMNKNDGYTETEKMLLLVTGWIMQYCAVSDKTKITQKCKELIVVLSMKVVPSHAEDT